MRALDTDAVRAWAEACVRDLHRLRADIDGINVYPVPDSDTGSNLLHTMTAARDALASGTPPSPDGVGGSLAVLAHAAVRAAKGNSGTILSQVLWGLAESARGVSVLDGPELAAALRSADRAATRAVARPVAGTMLSVLHAVVVALDATGEPPQTVAEVATLTAKSASAALAETPNQLAALAAAGVVDAGGRGLVAVFDALVEIVTGLPTSASLLPDRCVRTDPAPPARAWEVMYLLSVPPAARTEHRLSGLRRALSALGDSVTVADAGGGEYAVHVHCADIGAAVEAGLDLGRPHHVRVEPLRPASAAVDGEGPAAEATERAVVAVVHGDALARLVAAEGVPVLRVEAGAEPSAEQLLGAVTETAAAHVTVLPGGVRLTALAHEISGHPVLVGRDVVVVPCASPVQVLAALAVHDPGRRAGADVVAMAEAAAATRRGELVVAEQDAITWIGRVSAGDALGLIDGEVVLVEPRGGGGLVERAATGLLDRMLAVGGELVTVLVGEGAPAGVEDVLADHLRATRPDVELVCYSGGQTDAVLLMGVE